MKNSTAFILGIFLVYCSVPRLCTCCGQPHNRLECQAGHTTSGDLLIAMAGITGFFTGTWFTNEIVGGLVAGILSASLVLVWQKANHWRKYRQPWFTEYEPRRDDVHGRIDIQHQDVDVQIPLTLRFQARTHVDRIRFSFDGGSNPPEIKGLFDWNLKEGLSDPNVLVNSNERGSWYWHYRNQLLRTSGPRGIQNTIAVGIIVQTRGVFDGCLAIQVAFEERDKMPKPERMPFHVTRGTRLS